jgi:hypothetical protein
MPAVRVSKCPRKIEMSPGVQSRDDTPLWSGSGGGRAPSPRRSAAPDRRPMPRSLKSHPLSTERALARPARRTAQSDCLGWRPRQQRDVAPAPWTANPAPQGCSAAVGEQHARVADAPSRRPAAPSPARARPTVVYCRRSHRAAPLYLVEHPETEGRSIELNRDPPSG